MKKLLVAALLSAAAFAAPVSAAIVVAGAGTLANTDPAQADRTFRDGTASSWASPKAYPGTLGGTYVYDVVAGTHASNAFQDIYYQITYTSVDGAVFQPFAVAYNGAFNPASIGDNYVGDSGVSLIAGETGVFQVVVGMGGSLNAVFSEVSTGFLPTNYTYKIEAFSDASFGENFIGDTVPEPATWAMMIGGFALAGAAMRRRQAAVSFA